jgi:hypothetical protein
MLARMNNCAHLFSRIARPGSSRKLYKKDYNKPILYHANLQIQFSRVRQEPSRQSHISGSRAFRLGRAVGLVDVRQRTRLSTWSVIFI